MATRAIICNVCGFRLDGRVKGFPDKIEWTHSDRECQDFLRERNAELVTALEALLALWLRLDEWTHGIREERAEWLRTFLVATQNAQALLNRLKAP